jgi:6-phosphogluconolactonase
MNRYLTAVVVALALASFAVPTARAAGDLLVYVGTYTGKGDKASKGIYVMKLEPATGKLSAPELAGEATNPSFVAFDPTHKYLYAVGEVDSFGGKKSGGVSAFAVDPTSGKLTLLNAQPSGGRGPAFVAVDPTGKAVLAANYGSGSFACLPVSADGKLGEPASVVQDAGKGPDAKRQEGPHAHSINVDPSGKFALGCDLGLDKVFVFKLDPAAASLTANDPPAGTVAPGAGPRHTSFHPDGKHAFVINEMGNTITVFRWDAAKGTLTEVQSVPTLPAGANAGGNTTAEVVVHPSGKFVYGSNRGHDSIADYAWDAAAETLTPIGHTPTGGKTPRNFNIDPTGTWLLAANQGSGTVTVFRVDAATGKLTATGESAAIDKPVCVKFLQR